MIGSKVRGDNTAGETTEEKDRPEEEEEEERERERTEEYGRMMIRNHFFLFLIGKSSSLPKHSLFLRHQAQRERERKQGEEKEKRR